MADSKNHAETPDTQVIIPDEQRFVFFTVKMTRDIAAYILLDPHEFSHLAQLTKIELRTGHRP